MGKRKSPRNDTTVKTLKKPKNMRESTLTPPTPRIDRTMPYTSEIFVSQISQRVRDTLLNMERVRTIKHPFSAENQEVFQEFQDSVRGTALQDLKLTEVALLLRGVMSLWKRQIESCVSDIHNLAAFVSNAEPAVIDVDNEEGNPQEGSEEVEILDGANVGNPETADLLNDRSKINGILNTRKRLTNSCLDVASSSQQDKIVSKNDGFQSVKPPSLSNNEISKLEYSTNDISKIQRWITELHRLPFECKLSNADVKRRFQNLIQRLSVIFKKYGIPVHGHMIKSGSDVCPQISSTYQDLFEDPEQSLEERILDDSQTPGQNLGSENASLQEEIGITVMERVTEKTLAETQVRTREMISEMQRSVVPKYARIPLIEENTAEFFRRVKLFEDKMKKVLACEVKKKQFDVRKYEMDVLEAANKETQDQGSSDISQDTEIPSPITNLIGERFEYNLGITFRELPNSSSSETNNSQKWVPLTQIFTHMKKMEKAEAARIFYAVLALLSFQNLDVKYENHYSAESVAINSTSVEHAQNRKYQRGLKIMSSRCPDVDREEIYLSPLTSLSRTNAFRQLEIRETERHEPLGIGRMRFSRNSGSSDEIVDGDLTHDIEREFIKSNCTVYKGELFGKSRARSVNNKESVVKQCRRKLKFSKSAKKYD